MRRLHTLALFAVVLALVLFGFAASSGRPALAVGSQIRTFVASTGSDANPCSRTAPCRTFGAALVQTASGGEIVALDSGGYGAVTISQAVTIVAAPGVQASISPSSGNAITVNASPSDTVILRNLNLNGQGGSNGVFYQGAAALFIENLNINGFANAGIWMSLASAADLSVTDTVVRQNATGIFMYSSSPFVYATVVRTRLEANGTGISAAGNVRATVKDTVASGNSAYGFQASSINTPVEINLEGCTASRNGTGTIASSGSGIAIVRMSNCIVSGNGTGISVGTNGLILSRDNNTVEGNTSNGSFSGSYTAK